jgi:hypothetical protein
MINNEYVTKVVSAYPLYLLLANDEGRAVEVRTP